MKPNKQTKEKKRPVWRDMLRRYHVDVRGLCEQLGAETRYEQRVMPEKIERLIS